GIRRVDLKLVLRLLGHGPVDNGDGCAECGVYIQSRRVQQVGVGRRIKAAIGIGAVARVPFFYLVIEAVAVNRPALELELPGRAFHAGLAVGLDEQLHVGVGGNLGADIAAVENCAARLGGKFALKIKEGRTDGPDDCNLGGEVSRLGALQRLEV